MNLETEWRMGDHQFDVLKWVQTYGPVCSFLGCSKADREAVRSLCDLGLLTGDYRHCSITDAGRAVLAEKYPDQRR